MPEASRVVDEAQGLFGRYLFGEHWSLVAGYRALGFDRESGNVGLELILHGPAIGVAYRF